MPPGRLSVDQVWGPKVQFCATCVHIARVAATPGSAAHHVCARLGYRTSPRYSFHCWTPRPAFRWAVEPPPRDEPGSR